MKRFELCAASITEIAKKVERPAIHHLPQLREDLIRRQIRIDNFPGDLVGTFNHLRRGQDAHPADLCIEPDEGRQVWFVVLKRVDIGFRSLLDELL